MNRKIELKKVIVVAPGSKTEVEYNIFIIDEKENVLISMWCKSKHPINSWRKVKALMPSITPEMVKSGNTCFIVRYERKHKNSRNRE